MSVLLAIVLMLAAMPAAARPIPDAPPLPLSLLAWEPLPPSQASAVAPADGLPSIFRPKRLLPALGGGMLGAVFGGGLGLLIGPVAVPVRDEFGVHDPRKDYVTMPAAVVGLWAGTTVGVLAGSGAPPKGSPVVMAVIGSALGSIMGGFGIGRYVGGGSDVAYVTGILVGSTAGAIGGLAIGEANPIGR